MKFFKTIFFSHRLYIVLFSISAVFVFGYFFPPVYQWARIGLWIFSGLVVSDLILLYAGGSPLECQRTTPNRMSMGDANGISLLLTNRYHFNVTAEIIDELPVQFQIRNFRIKTPLQRIEPQMLTYDLTPLERGDFEFGYTRVFVATTIGIVKRRYTFGTPVKVPVYPSFIQMQKYELLSLANRSEMPGIKKMRKAGKHSEFDQVRDYIIGDDYRLMNWKATAKRAQPMMNQYQEEKSKDVYNIIDLGRAMKMPFGGMTLLDYSINAALALSNIAIRKLDKTGLVTFSTRIRTFIPAERRNNQMTRIMEALYGQTTGYPEPDYELLCMSVKNRLHQRSLLILYTNFESRVSMQHHLPALQNLSRHHLVLVVLFRNAEIEKMSRKRAESIEEVYTSVIAEKFIFEKKLIVKELQQHGIHALLTSPGQLTTGLIDKYLELKAGERI